MVGLEHRYNVKKVNDPEGKHNDCFFFVLDPLHDETARRALYAYAAYTPNQELSDDLYDVLRRIEALDG